MTITVLSAVYFFGAFSVLGIGAEGWRQWLSLFGVAASWPVSVPLALLLAYKDVAGSHDWDGYRQPEPLWMRLGAFAIIGGIGLALGAVVF